MRLAVSLGIPTLACMGGCQTPKDVFTYEVTRSLEKASQNQLARKVAEQDIAHLPAPMQRYLRYAGVVGKPPIRSARVIQSGLFKMSLGGDFKKMTAEEYYFPQERAFYWLGDVQFAPLMHFFARDKYSGGIGNVWVKFANIFTVADGLGFEFNISCLIRYFNEIVWFPSAFLDSSITWKSVDSHRAIATMSDAGLTTSATIHFNDEGEIVLFESDDRFATLDGKMVKAPWRTPMRDYKEFDGFKVPTRGEAIYRLPSGDFEYGRIQIDSLQVNLVGMYEKN